MFSLNMVLQDSNMHGKTAIFGEIFEIYIFLSATTTELFLPSNTSFKLKLQLDCVWLMGLAIFTQK